MLALSIRAPWWWFILHGGKDIENRDWPTRYRGPVLIHASKWFGKQDVRDDFAYAATIAERQGRILPRPITLGMLREAGGAIVGRARIVDCVTHSLSPWFFGEYGFVLADAETIAQPIPLKGALGLFPVPDAIAAQAIETEGGDASIAAPSRSDESAVATNGSDAPPPPSESPLP